MKAEVDTFLTVIKSGVVEHILSFAKAKQDQMMKKTDGHKRARFVLVFFLFLFFSAQRFLISLSYRHTESQVWSNSKTPTTPVRRMRASARSFSPKEIQPRRSPFPVSPSWVEIITVSFLCAGNC